MGITIGKVQVTGPKTVIAKERLFVNADRTKVVPEGSVEAAFLLVRKGGELEYDLALQYGLVETEETSGKSTSKESKAGHDSAGKESTGSEAEQSGGSDTEGEGLEEKAAVSPEENKAVLETPSDKQIKNKKTK